MTAKAISFNKSAFKSDVVQVIYPASLCSSDCDITVVIQNIVPVVVDPYKPRRLADEAIDEVIVQCNGTEHTQQVVCPMSDPIAVHCNSSIGSFRVGCPVHTSQSVCGDIEGSRVVGARKCSVLSYTQFNTTCLCKLTMTANPSSPKQTVQFVSMLKYTVTEFTQTWASVGSLDASTVEKNWKVLLTVGIACVAAIVGAIGGYKADEWTIRHMQAERSLVAAEASKDQTVLATLMVENSLPNVLKETPFIDRLAREMKVYHRWLGIIYHYCDHFSRATRVLSLVTSIAVMLFANAVTYNVAYPDDGSCQHYTTSSECLQQKSSFSGGSKCYWDDRQSSCAFSEPADQMQQVVFVAVIAAIMSTPIAVYADYIIMTYIAAKVKDKDSDTFKNRRESRGNRVQTLIASRRQSGRRRSARLHGAKKHKTTDLSSRNAFRDRRVNVTVSPSVGSKNRATALSVRKARPTTNIKSIRPYPDRRASGGRNEECELSTSLQEDMSMLLASLKTFRDQLSDNERSEFDGEYALSFVMWSSS